MQLPVVLPGILWATSHLTYLISMQTRVQKRHCIWMWPQNISKSKRQECTTRNPRYRLKGWAKLDGDNRRFLVTNALGAAIRPVIRSVMKARPYALRAYFDTRLLIAESHGCMTHAYRQFFMGQKGDMEARYTTNKGKLTNQMTEDMRRAYEQSQPFLSTDGIHDTESDKHKMLVGMWRQQAKMYGFNIDEILTNNAIDKMQDDACTPPQKTMPAKQGGSSAAGHNDDRMMIV